MVSKIHSSHSQDAQSQVVPTGFIVLLYSSPVPHLAGGGRDSIYPSLELPPRHQSYNGIAAQPKALPVVDSP